MKMHYVDSSNLESVGYDENTNTLFVEFKKNGIYQYFGVPQYVFAELLTASSPGTYLNENVKNTYPFSKN